MSKDDENLDPEVERVVDELLAADNVIERYRERCTALGRQPEFDPPSLVDRLMLVHTTMLGRLGGPGGGLNPDQIMSHLEKLRKGLFEEVKAHIDQIMTGHVVHDRGPMGVLTQVEEENAPKHGAMPVVLTPADVHATFELTLLQTEIDMPSARKTLELLLTTPAGNDLLQLMVYDAVIIKRKKDAKKT